MTPSGETRVHLGQKIGKELYKETKNMREFVSTQGSSKGAKQRLERHGIQKGKGRGIKGRGQGFRDVPRGVILTQMHGRQGVM